MRRDLAAALSGAVVANVIVSGARSIRRYPDAARFGSALVGTRLDTFGRWGKYLLVGLDSSQVLVAHLRMSGQFLLAPSADEPLAKHSHVRITFTDGRELRFVDPRTFGELFVTTMDELEHQVPELAHLGFDPLEDVMSWTDFGEMLQSKQTKLKALLMDQKFVAGIGNIYSDEILFNAGLRYDRSSDSLTSQEVRRLYRAMIETLQEAVKHRGSSLADEQYKDLFGEIGDFQSQHKVYDREGQACRRCRSPILRVRVAGRSHFLCGQCQV